MAGYRGKSKSPAASIVGEATPLLTRSTSNVLKWRKSVLFRALLCGFMVSLSFGITQVPLIFVFRVMSCDAYYKDHPEPVLYVDKCSKRPIEASTALAVSILSASTTIFGVINLFVTGWTIKRMGIKISLAIQVFWPAVRLAIQNIGVMVGGSNGIIIIQCSQIITIVGGPSGYLLSLNSFVTEVVESEDRTGSLGRLQGFTMFGTSIGYLLGGLISDKFGIVMPFRATLAMFCLCSLYVIFFLPGIPQSADSIAKTDRSTRGLGRFFGPLKVLFPQKWILPGGRIKVEYGALVLGIGVYAGVLATGFLPVLLQLYSTDVLEFGTTENSYLVSLYAMLRGLFLTLAFPRIISIGRDWLTRRQDHAQSRRSSTTGNRLNTGIPDLPTDPREFAALVAIQDAEEPVEPPKLKTSEEHFDFDLLYTRYSLLADGVLTGLATFTRKGWQVFLVAALLPFASGTGSAAKGTILQMCPAQSRTDALSAITLVDMIARLSTTTLFGLVFAALAQAGRPELVFACNAGVALVGFLILIFSRFPPEGSRRYIETTSESSEDQ